MSGQINNLINTYVGSMSKGDQSLKKSIYIRLAMNGILYTDYTPDTYDDPNIISIIESLARQANIEL